MSTFGQQIPPRITALSYSRIGCWEKCPAQAKFKFIDRIPEPDSIYAARGTELHTQCEQFLKREAEITPALSKVGLALENLRNELDEELHTELQCAWDKDWDECEWFGPQVFMRAILDVAGRSSANPKRLVVVDHKSGKVYPTHDEQLALYAMLAFHKWLDVDEVDVRIIYIDQGFGTAPKIYTRDQLVDLHETWDPRLDRITSDTVFAPCPSSKVCHWCSYAGSKGGPCEHG